MLLNAAVTAEIDIADILDDLKNVSPFEWVENYDDIIQENYGNYGYVNLGDVAKLTVLQANKFQILQECFKLYINNLNDYAKKELGIDCI